MKTIQLLAALAAFTVTSFAADVVVLDPNNVTIDGVAANAFTDAVRNNPSVRSLDFQKGLLAWAKAITDAAAAKEAAQAAAEADAAKKLEAAEALQTVLEKPDATPEEKAAAKAKLTESKTPEIERERKRLRAEKERIQAELDKLPVEKADGLKR